MGCAPSPRPRLKSGSGSPSSSLRGNKSKLGASVNESEETIDTFNSKIAAAERTKHRNKVELEDLQEGEWKAKAADFRAELEACSWIP